FHHLLPEFNAMENVIIPGLIQGKISESKRQYAEHLMETFGIAGRVEHYPHELSGGEKQRVALARALINKPALVLADEPTGNLDRQTGARLLNAILQFSKEHNQSFVIATHDDDIAKQADRILLLDNGIILETEQLEEGIH
ncbi:MAG: ATP-binding cassette domain-containing protein, partial [Candidatus Marinimicrobia bacterium]|nr:ATP-binding cassette domain-containing protein [Candidatus Neomarinimicrobiota bacterium]